MKTKLNSSKRGYLIETLKNGLFFLIIGPIHELIHALTALFLGGQVYAINFLPNHAGNLTTMVAINGYFKQSLVALSPGIILGILGLHITKKSFNSLKIELKNASNINPKIYSNIFKLTIGIVALTPIAYGLLNVFGSAFNFPSIYSGDYTVATNSIEQGIKQKYSSLYELLNILPEPTKILLVTLLTTLVAAGFYISLGSAFKVVKVIVPKSLISRFKLRKSS